MVKPRTDDPPRPTNGATADTVADAIPHDKTHTRETYSESASYVKCIEFEKLSYGKELFGCFVSHWDLLATKITIVAPSLF